RFGFHLGDSTTAKMEPKAGDRASVPLRWRKGDHPFDALLERRNPQHATRQFYFPIHQHHAFARTRARSTTILEVRRPIADPKAQVGASRSGASALALTKRRQKTPLRRSDRVVVRVKHRPLIERIDNVRWGKRLTRQCSDAGRTSAIPVEVYGPS